MRGEVQHVNQPSIRRRTTSTCRRYDARTWRSARGMLAHCPACGCAFLGPLIVWLIKKDQSPFVGDQAKEALNFQISRVDCDPDLHG